MISCDPKDLVRAAKCFQCVPASMEKAVELYLLSVNAGLPTSVSGVRAIQAAAKCFQCIPRSMHEAVVDYLLCQLANKGGSASGPTSQTYSTTFQTVENPLSEGGLWLQGATDGLDWSNVEATVNGGIHYAAGLQNGSGQPNFSDATAILKGTWGPNQSVTCVFHGAGLSQFKEAEIRLRSSLSAHSNKGYEIDFSVSAASPYIAVVRWNGALGDFTDITPPPGDTTDHLQDGDTVFASIIGNNIIVKLNGVTIYNFTDNSYATGNPGIGFSVPNNVGVDTSYGWSSFTATDGL